MSFEEAIHDAPLGNARSNKDDHAVCVNKDHAVCVNKSNEVGCLILATMIQEL